MQQVDRGWAWVVLAASMGGNFLVGVLCYFVGVVHTGLLDRFQSSVSATAWVGSLYSSNMCLAAPLASALINRYGCRVCCVVGGVLCFAGFIASAYVTSIAMLFLTYGMLAGIGLGLCYSPTLITIGFYFDKYRGLASGISVGFTAVGILSGSLITQSLIDEYSVSGAFLLIGALSLHFCFFGMFFRPTQFETKKMSLSVSIDMLAAENQFRASRLSLALHGVEIRPASSLHSGLEEEGGSASRLRGTETTDFQTDHRATSLTSNDVTAPNDDTVSLRLLSVRPNPDSDDVGSVISEEVTKRLDKNPRSGTRDVKTNMLTIVDNYLAVLTNKAFMLHCLSAMAANIHVSGVYLHLPEYVQGLGTSPTQAAALFVAVGVFSLLSRLMSGVATTEPKIDPLTLNMGMMGLCGLFTAFFPLYAGTYSGQLVFSAFFGLYTGGLYAMVNVLTVQLIGVSLLPAAFGVQLFIVGVGYLSGPPLAAVIVDNGGTYEHGFIFLGLMMVLGSFLDMAAGAFSTSLKEEEGLEIVSSSRGWLGGSIIISIQETGSVHIHQIAGSVKSVSSRHSQDVKR